jgi:hypothetical protein
MTISVYLRGGLGNQLFQYAAGLFLSSKQGEPVVYRGELLPLQGDSIGKVSRWPVQLGEFKMRGELVTRFNQPFENTEIISKLLQTQRLVGDLMPSTLQKLGILAGEKTPAPDFKLLGRIHTVNSYCTSKEPALALGLQLKSDILSIVEPTKAFLELMSESEANRPISIHMRLGDYKNLRSIYGKISLESLEKTLWSSTESAGRPIWLFTDSPEDVDGELMKRLRLDRVIGPNHLDRPLENLLLMSRSFALFCSNSSFSWWAAFLMEENRNVYYPVLDSIPVNNFSSAMTLSHWRSYAA